MVEIQKCPKCRGEMTKGSDETLGRTFGCTRGESTPETSAKVEVRSYYCARCGYMEFYREHGAREVPRPYLTEDADKATELHRKEKKRRPRIEETERKESERRKALARREGKPASVPSRERSYV
jgi:predicted nucleic-acid-binding Zn-ribbon protein